MFMHKSFWELKHNKTMKFYIAYAYCMYFPIKKWMSKVLCGIRTSHRGQCAKFKAQSDTLKLGQITRWETEFNSLIKLI